ncbi:hypothetical protein [Flavobacterium rhizosphaerae]|uniref:Anti-sigma factor n=1 Tax=Flavobacterium rhizosphaerae TaxID=3163298 RepID=A0ABW8Z1W0_9FLAO
MKKYNLDEQLRQKLGKNTITPSAHAWERVMHNREGNKSKKDKKYIWFSVAACMLLLSAIAYTMFVNNTQQIAIPANIKVVEAEKPIQNNQSDSKNNMPLPVKNTPADTINLPVVQTEPRTIKKAVQPEELTIKQRAFISAIQAESQNVSSHLKLNLNPVNYLGTVSSETEANRLLTQATGRLAANKQEKEATNDSLLLSEVENEMNQYYRNKAMNIFSLKYKKIRIAVRDGQ